MEFKSPTKHSAQRSKLTVPQRTGTAPHPNLLIKTPRSTIQNRLASLRKLFSAKPARRIAIVTGILLVTIGILTFSGVFAAHSNNLSKTPEYQTVIPQNKSIDKLGGWQRISPPKGEPVFAYADTIDTVPISVSQQPLPKSLEGNTDTQIADLAKKFNATTKIDAAGTKIYIGTSAKGPQSVILTKKDLLILIKSQQNISNDSWARYAQSLN